MAHSDILLIEPVEGLGAEGDQVRVKAGYARNYLLPRKKAIHLTQANRKRIEALKERRLAREAKNLEDGKAKAAAIEKAHFAIAVKTGESGKMFGSVTAADILAKLEEAGLEVDRRAIQLEQPIKELGQHAVALKVHADVEAELKFDVVSENPIVEEIQDEEGESED